MKKELKTIVNGMIGGMIGTLMVFTINVAAETLIGSEAVSYSNNKTSETTVNGALNELFSAVDINEKIGDMAKISRIGDGTITGAISSNLGQINSLNSSVSSINTSLSGKQATITGGASTIASSNLTASRALVSNSSGKVAVSAVTSTELGYLDGVTSNVQTQLNAMINPPNLDSVSMLSSSLVSAVDTSYVAPKAGYYKFISISEGNGASLTIYNASKVQIASSSSSAMYTQADSGWLYLKNNQKVIYYILGVGRLYYCPQL